jgi:hypothetical protein
LLICSSHTKTARERESLEPISGKPYGAEVAAE